MDMLVIRAESNARDVPSVQFTTANMQAREVDTGGKLKRLRFTVPAEKIVSVEDLPASVPVGKGRLIIKRFTDKGFSFEEQNTSGEWVIAEVYLTADADPREDVQTVRSELEAELAERKAREWPRLTPKQKQRLTSLLQRTNEHEAGERQITITRNDLPDIVCLVDDLTDVFIAAGWELSEEPDRAWKMIRPGLHVRAPFGHTNADLLASGLSEIFGDQGVTREIIGSPLPTFFNRAFVVQLAVGRRPGPFGP